jgi:hypothetical protein
MFLVSILFFWIWFLSAISFLDLVPLYNFIFAHGPSKLVTKHHL